LLEWNRKSRQGAEQCIRAREEGRTDREGLGPGIGLWSRDICKGVVKYSESNVSKQYYFSLYGRIIFSQNCPRNQHTYPTRPQVPVCTTSSIINIPSGYFLIRPHSTPGEGKRTATDYRVAEVPNNTAELTWCDCR